MMIGKEYVEINDSILPIGGPRELDFVNIRSTRYLIDEKSSYAAHSYENNFGGCK